jgi:hypothetical protein
MIQAGQIHHLQKRMDGSCFWIIGTVDQAADAGMNCRSRAHGTRLNCSKQFARDEAMVSYVSTRFAQGDDFCVGGWIVVREIAVPTPAHYASLVNDNGSNGHFIGLQCALGATKGLFHPEFVGGIQVG